MAAKLTRLTHKIAIQLHLVAESCATFSSRSRGPVRKLLDTPSYIVVIRIYSPTGNYSSYLKTQNSLLLNIGLGALAFPDDDDRDGHRNVGILCTPNAADSPKRLYQVHFSSFTSVTYIKFIFKYLPEDTSRFI
jgi:hypothetical protein